MLDPARARTHDPYTSHEAAADMEQTGHAERQQQRCLAAVEGCPGCTARELARKTGIAFEVMHKRLPELRGQGLLVNLAKRRCNITDKLCLTWYPQGYREGELFRLDGRGW